MPINDRLAKQALEKIKEQDAVIADLCNRLRITDDLGSAIQKSVENPASGQPRNQIVSNIVREGLFRGEKPVSKAARHAVGADRRRKLQRELQVAKGLRPKDT